MTYADVVRETAANIEEAHPECRTAGCAIKRRAAHLRALADLLDSADKYCVGTKEADDSLERISAPLSDP